MKKLIASLAALALCTSSATYAGWQGLEWGMSPAVTGRMCVDTYTTGPFTFDVKCKFEPGLKDVNLFLRDGSSELLLSVIRKKYGIPVSSQDGPLLTMFVWRDDVNQIAYVKVFGAPARVNYQPLKSSGSEGL